MSFFGLVLVAGAFFGLSLLMLERDDDGWDDLWVLLQKRRDKYGVTWNSVVGSTYSLETSLDLVGWTDLPGDFVATKATTITEVANLVGEGKRFWRVKRLEP